NEYVFGFTWWDRDLSGRRQAVRLGTGEPVQWMDVLPPAFPLAFHADEPTYARIQLPVPVEAKASSQMRLAFDRRSGPDVAVNEVWILRRTEGPPRKRVVIVTGDDWTGHHWRATGPELAGIIRTDPRLEVSVVESPAVFTSPLINLYDAAVIHFKDYANRLPLDDAVWKGLDSFVAGGRGLVIAHFGCGAFQEWGGYVELAGRIWDPAKRGHDPYGPFHVQIADDSHAISRGMMPFDATDELYTCLVGAPEIQTLFSATSCVDQQVYPMGFVVSGSRGRVFHSSLGHDVAALRGTGTIELYRRATAWAAGLPVQRPVMPSQ
ncbi:MAG: ThuA domain-containing protein, partial [Candidatus Hydrogenedentes bacterium]|nr:ThuA domain-containing protein [Candidatus Hydrogenedentota bacterium]